jgi:hypothetical protein
MPAARNSITRYRTITVHPPEAEAIAKAFCESGNAAETDLIALEKISGILNSGWEGNQKTRYLEELNAIINRIRNILLPQIRLLEKKYRDYSVEKPIEEAGTK